MKLNNKGLSITELLVSLVLISGIMFFLYNLLYKVNEDYYENDFAINNQTVRFEIIKEVQNDILENNLLDINHDTENNTLSFIFESGLSTLGVFEDKITYTNINNANNTFVLKDSKASLNINLCQSKLSNNKYLVEILIPIYKDEKVGNFIDDIIFSFVTDTNLGYHDCLE